MPSIPVVPGVAVIARSGGLLGRRECGGGRPVCFRGWDGSAEDVVHAKSDEERICFLDNCGAVLISLICLGVRGETGGMPGGRRGDCSCRRMGNGGGFFFDWGDVVISGCRKPDSGSDRSKATNSSRDDIADGRWCCWL